MVGEGEGAARLEPAHSEDDGVRALGAVKDVQEKAADRGDHPFSLFGGAADTPSRPPLTRRISPVIQPASGLQR